MQGRSYQPNTQIRRADLRYLKVRHYDYDGQIHQGELICNKRIASKLLAIFKALYEALVAAPGVQWALGLASPQEIDRLNILRATHLAMARALAALPGGAPDFALVDGLPVRGLPCAHEAVVKGDARCFLVAAASIVAKVSRDRILRALDAEYPGYGFAEHKGYPTESHLAAIARLGISPAHRRSFGPVRDALNPPML